MNFTNLLQSKIKFNMRVIGMESQQLLDEEEEKQAIGIGKQAI
jgi:hypothetical protein